MENWFSRTELLLGEQALEHFKKSHVFVVGLGGVGAMAAEMICRAGIGKMTIMDADVVSFSNLNRQLPALHSTISKKKAQVVADRLKDINPELQLNIVCDFLTENEVEKYLFNDIDFVVDAIDTISPKVALIKTCLEKKIPIVSSMGSGAKIDPTKVNITDISKTQNCTLARTIRQRLKKEGITKGLPVVSSLELPNKNAVKIIDNEKNKKSTTGTISYMPAVFGCFLASYVIKQL